MDKKRLSIVVRGRVQGVGFRYFCRDIARGLGLTGWVRNRIDKNVEIEVQGEAEDMDIFCEEIRIGPTLSHVDHVVFSKIPLKEDEKTFEIHY